MDDAASRCPLTSKPRRLNAELWGMSNEVRGVVFRTSARDVEKTAAKNEERSSMGSAVWRASDGGMRGRDTK